MSVTIRGTRQILKWGTNALTAYIVADESENKICDNEAIQGENGTTASLVTGIDPRIEVSISFVPLSTATAPTEGASFTCPSGTVIYVTSVEKKRSRKSAEVWTVTGTKYEDIT